MVSYYPFVDRAHLLRCALQDAISWEESVLDAGCAMGDEAEEALSHARIKAYRAYLKRNAPDAVTMREAMMKDLDGAESRTIQEIHAMSDTELKRLGCKVIRGF